MANKIKDSDESRYLLFCLPAITKAAGAFNVPGRFISLLTDLDLFGLSPVPAFFLFRKCHFE